MQGFLLQENNILMIIKKKRNSWIRIWKQNKNLWEETKNVDQILKQKIIPFFYHKKKCYQIDWSLFFLRF